MIDAARGSSADLDLHLALEPAADELLSRDPFALLAGMLLDQQFPMERAFAGPRLLADRMGVDRLDPAAIAGFEPESFALLAAGPPAVHRYPGSMADVVDRTTLAEVRAFKQEQKAAAKK